jgi:cell division septation protein DedD
MHKFILIAAMVLVSATAQAGGSRGLILVSNDEPATASPAPKAVDTKPADSKPVDVRPAAQPTETPKYVDQPAVVDTKAGQSADQCPCAAPINADAPRDAIKTVKPKRRHQSTEARVIYELRRHGIYW